MFGGNRQALPEKVIETMKRVGYRVGAGFTREVQEDNTIHADCDKDVNGNEAENGVKHWQRPIGNTRIKLGLRLQHTHGKYRSWKVTDREALMKTKGNMAGK
ncbi:hypothetical protein VNO78_01371 [Psophocarpus tetragonolobus]|uniref:Uncharacterized protein n=1 Tax=Psophocarpus tetragonolobus TaxID=3891 RepID=A0AAN9SZ14_PSOTE